MNILVTTATATGVWYLITKSGDFLVGQQSTDVMGGGTLYIDIGTTNKVAMPDEADRTFATPMPPKLLTLAAGQHIRGRVAGAAAADINLSAISVNDPNYGLVASP